MAECELSEFVFNVQDPFSYTKHMARAYRSPRVFGDKFGETFGDKFGDSLNFVINMVTILVTHFVRHQICHNFW